MTPFAALPGALIGALPPAMGWAPAAATCRIPSIHLVAFFFFLWQIPHFWLLLLFYAQDYQAGGLPSLLDRFDRGQVLRLTFLWIAAVAPRRLLLPLHRCSTGRGSPTCWRAQAAAGLARRGLC